MADGNRTWARVPHDMGANKIEHLGRSTVADGAARIDDIRIVASGPTDPGADTLIMKVESLDGTVAISEDTATHKVNFGVTPASATGGKLYTAFVPDPLSLPSVDAVFHEQGGCDPSVFGTMWTEIASGVWRRNVAGHLLGALTDDVSVWAGMRLFAWSGAVEQNHTGPYVLDDIGQDPVTHADTYPQMHRAPDFASTAQVLHGAWFAVLGGTAWGPTPQTPPAPPLVHAFRLTNADPVGEIDVANLTWEFIDAPTPAPTNELLTASQLSLAAAYNSQATAFASGDTHEVELQIFTEHDTALGGQTLPADGPIRAHIPLSLWTDDPYADTFVHLYLRAHAPAEDEAWVLVVTTQALHNTELGVFVAVGTMGSDYPIPVGSSLQAWYTVETNSVLGISIDFLYNDPAHRSYIEIPAVIGFAGTDDHQKLIDRGVFLDPASPTKYGHPMSFIEPGRAHSPVGAKVTTVDGLFAMPPGSNSVWLDGTEPLRGIATDAAGADPWQAGDKILIWFASARTVQGSATVPSTHGSVYLPTAQFQDPTNPGAGPQAAVTPENTMVLMYNGGGYWLFVSASLG